MEREAWSCPENFGIEWGRQTGSGPLCVRTHRNSLAPVLGVRVEAGGFAVEVCAVSLSQREDGRSSCRERHNTAVATGLRLGM